MVGKATLALVLATICAAPMLAAASGRSAGATRAARSRRYSASRYRGVPTFADSASDDVPTYDDPQVRHAALDALGRYNGTVVAVDPNTGRILPDEHPGALPTRPPAYGGVARMSSFGEGIQMTPLQLAALASAVANGGTLYFLQYSPAEDGRGSFEPRIKRQLDIASLLPP